MTNVELLRGPLGDDELRAVSELYGSHDTRYGDVDFCRYQFNRNPYGFSLHAFARVGGDRVGHFSLIPVVTRVGKAIRMTGKAEAMFMREDHRKRRGERTEESLAMTMVRRLYEFADGEGFADTHSLGRPAFAKIHAAGGARVLEFQRRQFAFFLRPEAVGGLLGDEVAPGRAREIFDRQQRLLAEARAEVERLAAERRDIGPGELGTLDVDAFMRLAPQDGRWTVAPTPESADWHLGSPTLRRMSATSGPDRFECVYSGLGSGTWFELFDWRCSESARPLALWSACRLIADAEREGRDLLCFFDWSQYNPAAGALAEVAERLGMEAVERPRLIYVRSSDPAFATPDGMTFSPYFYATF